MDELKSMTEQLLHEIKNIALSLNDKQITFLKYNPSDEDASINVNEIAWKFIKILEEDKSHRYLKRQLCIFLLDRTSTEF